MIWLNCKSIHEKKYFVASSKRFVNIAAENQNCCDNFTSYGDNCNCCNHSYCHFNY